MSYMLYPLPGSTGEELPGGAMGKMETYTTTCYCLHFYRLNYCNILN